MHFFPNSWDPFKKVTRMTDGKPVEELYDPNVNNVLEEIAQLAGSSAPPGSWSRATPTTR